MPTTYDVDLIHIIRNHQLDCAHRGRVVVVDHSGSILFAAGDSQAPGYLRSIGKPFQAAAMIASGAATRYDFAPEERVIAAGSHNGTPYHIALVAGMLDKIGLAPDALQCGISAPLNKTTYEELLLSGQHPGVLHHNCSGKHTGMLASCQTHGWDIDHYTHADHPVQQLILEQVAAAADLALDQIELSPDGCSVPTFGIPLYNVAVMFRRLGTSIQENNSPLGQIARLMQQYPRIYSGQQRLDADLTAISKGKLIVKDGAEGIVGVAVPEHGVGIALKVSDGSQRAIVPTLLKVLAHFGYLTADEIAQLEVLYPPVILNHKGERAADIQTVLTV
ncbi:MAG TPA: asparaginase [Phototrophicaceae bacterium]|jgi:L-asparaginase II|nr:asparaginase [Phototrophicaceae bacterium]